MRLYQNTRPSHGVAYRPWVDRVKELLDENDLELPSNKELIDCYWKDLSYEEVLYKVQFKTVKNVYMELFVKHGYGEFRTHFQTSEQAKEFFKRFPELRKELDRL